MFKDQQGIALLVTMILLGTVIATALGVAVLITGESGVNRLVSDSVKAVFAADAGMEKLLYFANKISGDPAIANFKKNMETGDTGFTSCPGSSACYFACEAAQNCTSDILRSKGQSNTALRSFEASY